MSKTKIAIVEPTVQSTWGSCLTIMPNLVQAYRDLTGGRFSFIDYGRHSTPVSTFKAATKIFSLQPDVLVFIDHLRHPLALLKALEFTYGKRAWPRLIFHVYGDFTLHTPDWKKSESILKDKSVQFVCASPRQREMISSFLRAPAQASVCPFPVSRDEFHHQENLRVSERRRRGYADDEFVMVYTGRLSLQKNILKMILELKKSATDSKKNWRLELAGAFDDLGSPFFNIRIRPNGYFEAYRELTSALPKEIRKRITLIGSLDKPELRALYHAADLFVSFSTHHDEDYGMSPIEALCCGTRALISDWGGFEGFGIDANSTTYVPISLRGSGPHLHVENLKRDLLCLMNKSESELQRAQRSEQFLSAFATGRARQNLDQLMMQKPEGFKGFSKKLKLHSKLTLESQKTGQVFKLGTRVDPNYREVYNAYLAPERRRP